MKVNNVSTLIDATKAMIATHKTICSIAAESKNNPDEYDCACMVTKMLMIAKILQSAINVSMEILEHNDIMFINGDFYAKIDTINPTPVENDEAENKQDSKDNE